MAYKTHLRELKLQEQAKRGEAMTWQQIADEVGIAYSTIQRYVHESVPSPDYSVIDRLAEYFGVSVRDLIYRVEDDETPEPVGAGAL